MTTVGLSSVTRPVMRYHGGKWRLAPWIISHFPPHRIYVEPFGGAASVLLRKQRSYAEVYNDLSEQIVNVFRVMRDEKDAQKLIEMIQLTPYSRSEFIQSYEDAQTPIEQARRTIFRSMAGFGSAAATRGYRTGFRSNSNRSGTTPASDWRNYPDALAAIIDRFRGVVVENKSAIEVMLQHDSSETLHYVDPPYVHSTRNRPYGIHMAYEYEMDDSEHEDLAETLFSLKGMVVLSGYDSCLYNRLFSSWRRLEVTARSDGAGLRTETLWLNLSAQASLDKSRLPLFAEVMA